MHRTFGMKKCRSEPVLDSDPAVCSLTNNSPNCVFVFSSYCIVFTSAGAQPICVRQFGTLNSPSTQQLCVCGGEIRSRDLLQWPMTDLNLNPHTAAAELDAGGSKVDAKRSVVSRTVCHTKYSRFIHSFAFWSKNVKLTRA